jgi:diacylglycerol kinase family enzyme
MLASLRAGLAAFLRPPRLAAALSIDGREFMVRASGISVTCNLLGEGRQLPYAERPDGGVLGIYVTRARRRRDLARLALGALLGRWRRNAALDVYSGREVELRLLAHHRRFGCAMDGELADLAAVTRLRIRPGALKVLVPAAEGE